MNEQELMDRTKQFALWIIRLVESLPKSSIGNVSGIVSKEKLEPLLNEADELTAIFVSSIRTVRGNNG
jgi:hypothetical protein